MILPVEEARRLVDTDEDEFVLTMRLQALETAIHGYTNNNFRRVLEENGGEYPADIKMGVVNLLKWDMNHRDNMGVESETISRHSITYGDMAGKEATAMGYPRAMVAFLKPYTKARFGQGGSV